MLKFSLSLQLNISSDRDKSRGMTDWIDDFDNDSSNSRKRQEHRRQIFGPKARRIWEALVAQIQHDAARMNAASNVKAAMKGTIEINNRELIPGDSELNVDKPFIPSVYLDINLDTGAESIKIAQRRKETFEGDSRSTNERLNLQLTDGDEMFITDANGQHLTIEKASEYILRRFLK
jgi:hypothetical protein